MNPLNNILSVEEQIVYLNAAANPAFNQLLTFRIQEAEQKIKRIYKRENETDADFVLKFSLLKQELQVFEDMLKLNNDVIKHFST